jgi:hypothetical protein
MQKISTERNLFLTGFQKRKNMSRMKYFGGGAAHKHREAAFKAAFNKYLFRSLVNTLHVHKEKPNIKS